MPNLKLTNLTTYKAYFADIASKNKAVDGFKWGDKDVVKNDSVSDMVKRLLWAMPYEAAKYGDKNSDNVVKTKQAKVAYLILPDSELFADEDAAFETAEGVVEQIMAKIMLDKRGYDVAGDWTMIVTDINSWGGAPVEMMLGATKYIGYELTIDFQDNTGLEYDATKWL